MTRASSIRIAAISQTIPAAYRRSADGGYRGPVQRQLPGGYELDDDPSRLDLEAVHRYLSEEAYWALGRSRETVERLAREATRVVGIYLGAMQVGYCRGCSDGVSFAYLADVYVLPAHRGRGLGKAMVREMVEDGSLSGVSWILHTRDAHSLYASMGFVAPSARVMERPGR
jgi:GNAT superfamily N-acetyltransferase